MGSSEESLIVNSSLNMNNNSNDREDYDKPSSLYDNGTSRVGSNSTDEDREREYSVNSQYSQTSMMSMTTRTPELTELTHVSSTNTPRLSRSLIQSMVQFHAQTNISQPNDGSGNMNINSNSNNNNNHNNHNNSVVNVNIRRTNGNEFDDTTELTVSPTWLYEYSKHLYEKYIKNGCDLMVNVSSPIRDDLDKIFNGINERPQDAVNRIAKQVVPKNKPKRCHSKLIINNYLYHVFDRAFEEIWNLVQSDSFVRFRKSEKFFKFKQRYDSYLHSNSNCNSNNNNNKNNNNRYNHKDRLMGNRSKRIGKTRHKRAGDRQSRHDDDGYRESGSNNAYINNNNVIINNTTQSLAGFKDLKGEITYPAPMIKDKSYTSGSYSNSTCTKHRRRNSKLSRLGSKNSNKNELQLEGLGSNCLNSNNVMIRCNRSGGQMVIPSVSNSVCVTPTASAITSDTVTIDADGYAKCSDKSITNRYRLSFSKNINTNQDKMTDKDKDKDKDKNQTKHMKKTCDCENDDNDNDNNTNGNDKENILVSGCGKERNYKNDENGDNTTPVCESSEHGQSGSESLAL